MEGQVSEFIGEITRIHKSLSRIADLRPSEQVNGLFKELVGLCVQTLDTSVTKRVIRLSVLFPSAQLTSSDPRRPTYQGHRSGIKTAMCNGRKSPRISLGGICIPFCCVWRRRRGYVTDHLSLSLHAACIDYTHQLFTACTSFRISRTTKT